MPWLIPHRERLEILIHPNTDDAVADSTANALWLREKLLINLELPRQIS
jgi:aromatic ring-cleaving dioxygenase